MNVCFVFALILMAITINVAKCTTIEQAQKSPLNGYVLSDAQRNPQPYSGVRIGPLDLGYTSENLLNKYQIPSNITNQLKPYIGKKGQEAQTFLTQHPLTLNQTDFDLVAHDFTTYWMNKLDSAPPSLRNNPQVISLVQLAKSNNWPQFLADVDAIKLKLLGHQ